MYTCVRDEGRRGWVERCRGTTVLVRQTKYRHHHLSTSVVHKWSNSGRSKTQKLGREVWDSWNVLNWRLCSQPHPLRGHWVTFLDSGKDDERFLTGVGSWQNTGGVPARVMTVLTVYLPLRHRILTFTSSEKWTQNLVYISLFGFCGTS